MLTLLVMNKTISHHEKQQKKKNSKIKCNATSSGNGFIISARTTTDKDTEGKASFRKISNDGETN